MQGIVLLVFISSTFAEFSTFLPAVPTLFKYVPEAFSVVVALYVLFEGVRGGFSQVAPKYWIVFGTLTVIMVCGVLTNGVGSGPIVAGARFYVRAMPLFLLPAVARFTDKQILQQLKVLLAICLLQLPIAVYQRWVIYSAGRFSGDDVRGSVMDSGVLSIILICAVLILTGFFMRKRISRGRFLLLCALLLFPTTINETKATIILLPLGLLTMIIAAAPRGRRLRILTGALVLMFAFGAIFTPIYNFLNKNTPYKQERNLLDFFTSEKQFQQYMQAKKGTASVGTSHQVRRGDAVEIPLQYITEDPLRIAFGLGVGNASSSTLGPNFVGRYYVLFHSFVIMSFSVFVLEIGLLGTALIFLIYWLLSLDTLAVAKRDQSVVAPIAVGWIGVLAIMALGLFYTVTHTYASLSYLFWYFSGLIAAHRTQLALQPQRAMAVARNTAVRA